MPTPILLQYGAVCQVPLPPAHGQFAGQVSEDSVREPQVALGVFKVNRIYFVRHCERTDFTGNGLLAEVAQRYVTQTSLSKSSKRYWKRAMLSNSSDHVVMRFDLRGIGVPLQSQGSDERFCIGLPVDVGVSAQVRICSCPRHR